ncbi:MAG TPA: tetratricopeptide repeat protein, partial [Saprospiraceae bacterium]|nr:tetratricopeptide repeat protein [Saprospiraceae bacterium]
LLPLTVLLTQKVPVLQSNRVLQNQNLSYAIPQLICLALLLMSIVGWLANPYDPLLLLILWVMMGLSLLTFANSPIIGWIIVGIYVLTALVTMPYFNHKLLTVGSLYGLFFLFTPKKHSPDKKWWPHALWVLLAGGYLAATGSPATLGLLAITAGLLWLGTTRRVAKGNIIAMIASLGLTIYLGIEQSFLAMATGLSIGVFIATLQLKSLKKHRYTISFGLVTVIGIFALLQEQISSPTLPTSQVETVTIQIPEPVEDRNRRTLEFSENPLPFQATEKRLPTALNITQQYLQLLVWPAPLRFYYGYNMLPILDWSSPKVWGALFLLLGLSVLTLSAIFWDTWVAWGGILLLLSLAQFSNYLIPLPGIIGERFLYIGSLGFIVLMVQLSNLAIQKWQLVQKQRFRTIGVLLSVGLIVGVSLYVIKRNQHWKDRLTLYQHDITHLSQSAKAQQLLAAELLKKAEEVAEEAHRTMLLKEASKHFKACVAIYPNFPYGFFDLGTTQMKLGNYAEAQQSTERSLDVDVYNPQARFQLAMIHELQSEWLQAVDDYQMTITNHPDMLEAYLNLSTLLFRTGDVQDGLQIAYTALERWPNSLALLTNIGNVLASQRRYTEAAIYFTRALQQSAGERSLIEKIIFCYQQINRPDLAEPYLRMLQ